MRKVVRKQIAFNIEDAEQRELLAYARNLENFSGRMKKLLKKDYEEHLRLQQLQKPVNPVDGFVEGGLKIIVNDQVKQGRLEEQ